MKTRIPHSLSLAALAASGLLASTKPMYASVPVNFAYWTGDQSSLWNANNASNTNFSSDAAGTTDLSALPSGLEVIFSATGATNQNTTLGADISIKLLTIKDSAAVTIGGANTLTISGLAGTGIDVQSGAGYFRITSNLALVTSDTITVNNTSGAEITGVISGMVGLIKAGSNSLTLGGVNNYSGGTFLDSGTLVVGTNSALGSGNFTINGGTVSSQSAAPCVTIANHVDVRNDFAITPQAFDTLTFSGDVDLGDTTRTITEGTGNSAVIFSGAISGSAGINFAGLDDGPFSAVLFTGTTANTYTGPTVVGKNVVLALDKESLVPSIAGDLTINQGGSVFIFSSEQLGGDHVVTVNSTGSSNFPTFHGLNISGVPTTIGTLLGNGTIGLGDRNAEIDGLAPGTDFFPTGGLPGATLVVSRGDFSGVISDETSAFLMGKTVKVGIPQLSSGQGNLFKVSPDTLRLSGANTYTGQTIVAEGTLILDGSLQSSEVSVYAGATFSGHGVTSGNLLSGGIISPGNSPGTLTIGGNYTQQQTGVLQIEIASASNFDLLKVGGKASLNGDLQVITLNGFVPALNDQFDVLTANGGVTGKFASVDQSLSTVKFDVVYLPNAVRLEFAATQFEDFFTNLSEILGLAITPNQRAAARAIDLTSGDDRQKDVVDFLLKQDVADLPRDFDRIAPEEFTSLFEIVRSNSESHFSNITDQLALARAGVRGFSSRLTVADHDGKRMLDPKDGKSMAPVFAPTPDNNWGVWVSGNGEYVDVGDNFNASGFDFQTGGVTLGFDYRVSSEFILGAAASYAHTDTDLIENGDVTVEAGRLALYGTWYRDGIYLNGVLGGGLSNFDTHRRGLDGFANGSTDGASFDALLSGGYDLKAGVFTFGPTASLAYIYSDISGFDENGSLAPLSLASNSEDSLRSRVGGHLQANFKLGTITIHPEIRAEWQHEFADDTRSITASFANGTGGSFSVSGPTLGQDSAILGASVGVEWNPRCSTYVSYEAEVGRENYERQAVSAGVRVAF